MPSRYPTLRPWLSVILTPLLLLAFGWCVTARHRANARAWDTLQPGQNLETLLEEMARPADCSVNLKGAVAMYWSANQSIAPCPAAVERIADLPRAYASLQVLVSRDQRILALGFDGETHEIRTVRSNVVGSSLADLEQSFIE
jgi:hypothetical protein